jgi:G3E family GTPase
MLRCSLTEEGNRLPLALLDVGGHRSQLPEALHQELPPKPTAPPLASGMALWRCPLRAIAPSRRTKFEHFLMAQMPIDVFRAKGILWFDGEEQRHVFQLSGKRCSISPEPWTTPHPKINLFSLVAS